MLYECNPMAFLAEQAGGKASDGKNRILDIIPQKLHERAPFFVGNDQWSMMQNALSLNSLMNKPARHDNKTSKNERDTSVT